MIGEDGDAADPEEVAAAQEETERLRREEQRRAERKARAAQLVERQRREVAAREEDALHVRSASLRRYLATEVMPTVTDAMMQMLRLRPDDPAMALAEYLIRVDTRAEEEEEAERMANAVMERALLEEAKLREREEKLATSRRKAAEARAAIKPKSVVRRAERTKTETAEDGENTDRRGGERGRERVTRASDEGNRTEVFQAALLAVSRYYRRVFTTVARVE